RGEGIGMAARAGATISDAEFVQFHPTALDVQARPTPLATEALRGEGATLVNADGHRFMAALHDDAELAPRDIVARAVFEERASGRGAFLDCRSSIGAHFKKRFPTVYAHCQHHDLDPETDLIPVTPAAHYHMGGVATDLNARTDVVGLWAMGEVAATGLHGANRLASNSLLEATVMAARVAADITANTRADDLVQAELRACPPGGRVCEPERSMMLERLGQTLSSNVGVVRSQSGLNQALHTITKIHIAAKNSQDLALLNASLAAAFVVTSALARPESRGAHFRSDTPNAKPSFAHRSFVTLQDVTSAMTDVLSDPHQRAIHVSRSNKKPSTDPIAALHGVSA
ncbi:MAG: FAD-binding protein, partial [Pseudomonadota bacterium]